VAVTVTVSPEGTTTEKVCLFPITKLGNVVGLKTGSLSSFEEGGAIVTEVEAVENALANPALFVAFTLAV
jgi:hypothetical protein